MIPISSNVSVVSDTSSIPQHDVGTCLGVHTCSCAGSIMLPERLIQGIFTS